VGGTESGAALASRRARYGRVVSVAGGASADAVCLLGALRTELPRGNAITLMPKTDHPEASGFSECFACFREDLLDEIGMQAKMMLLHQFYQKRFDCGYMPEGFGA
jgi:hypothetical protein